jgi:hypothetical protein
VLHHAVFGRHRQWLLRRPITFNQRKQVQRNRPLCDCHHVNKVSNELFFALSRTHARVPITGERRSSCALLCLSGWLSPRSLCPAALTIQAPGARTIAMEATTAASSPLGNVRFRYRSSEDSARDASDDVMLSASGRDVADAIVRAFNAPRPGTVYDHRLDPIYCNDAVHRLEHPRRADRNALHVGTAGQYQPWIKFGRRGSVLSNESVCCDCIHRIVVLLPRGPVIGKLLLGNAI